MAASRPASARPASRIAYDLTSDSAFVLTLSHDGGHWDLSSVVADTGYLRDAFSRLGAVPPSR